MKRILFFGLLVCLFSGCHGIGPGIAGSGISHTEFRQVPQFDEIELDGFGTVNIIAGEHQSVHVTTDDNLLARIETRVDDGKLTINPMKNIRPQTELVIDVTVPQLTAARVSGAGDINVDGVYGEDLDLSISGSGDLRAQGQVANVSTKISGAGSADLQQLAAENAKVKISGAGHVDVFASRSIDARVSGVGTVDCYGNPTDVQQRVSGVGRVRLH